MRLLLNNIMQAERAKHIQAGEYERSEERKGHANGYKPKTVRTRMGEEIRFAGLQVREGGFYPTALENGLRSERALTMTVRAPSAGIINLEGQNDHRRIAGDRNQFRRLAEQRHN